MERNNSIKEYFKGKNIFITGGTGFLGKATIEKLLRSCPEVNKIYVLVRPKKGKVLGERIIDDIISSPVFSILKKSFPENLNKIVPIAGDVKELQLGICNKDRQMLKEQIHVIFHVAASVRFNDVLQDAIFINLRSAREIALLALEIQHLEVFLHVSTAFCNMVNRKTVEEILYPPNGDWNETIMIAENCERNMLNVLSHKFIGGFPNTYTYTKQLAEHCINDLLLGKVPTVIYRPSIVFTSYVDPYQGWIDNFNGPVGIMVGFGTGILRMFYCNPNLKLDYAPIDFVVKSMIVAAWHEVNLGNKNIINVYHGSSHNMINITYRQLKELGVKVKNELPLQKKIWYPNPQVTGNLYYYYYCQICFQLVPAIFLDLALKTAGFRPKFFKLQRKIYTANFAVQRFSLNEWNFINTKTFGLIKKIPKRDMDEFDFSMLPSTYDRFCKYILSSTVQCKKYLLNEGPDTDQTRFRDLMMYYLDKMCCFIFYGLLIWMVFFKLNILGCAWEWCYTYFCNLIKINIVI